jgi:crossover junction endodeoxyribonuclease RuvC
MGISAGDFQRLQQRLNRRVPRDDSGATGAAGVGTGPGPTLKYQRLVGIDPSLRGTGFGVIEIVKGEWRMRTAGTLRCPASWPRTRCLAAIATGIRDILRKHAPECCAVEGLFFAQNLRTALTMGEARGAALAVVAEAGLPVFEMAPRQVKLAMVGFGGAQKLAVAKMVQRRLALDNVPEADAADALALALAFAQTAQRGPLSRLKPL